MIRQQILKQFVFLLAAATWPTPDDVTDPLYGLPGERVFPTGSVVVSIQPPEDFVEVLAHPFAVIHPLDATMDPDVPGRVNESPVLLTVVARGSGDRFGQAAMIGANRPSQGQSAGHGVEELLDVVAAGLSPTPGELVDSQSGMQGYLDRQWRSRPMGTPELAAYDLEVVVTNATLARNYHSPRTFSATALGGGSLALAWVNPPARFDSFKNVLRRCAISGGAAPTSPTDGNGVVLATPLAVSVTDTPGAGVWTYSLFTAYDETHAPPSVAQRYSLRITVSQTAT